MSVPCCLSAAVTVEAVAVATETVVGTATATGTMVVTGTTAVAVAAVVAAVAATVGEVVAADRGRAAPGVAESAPPTGLRLPLLSLPPSDLDSPPAAPCWCWWW